MKKTLLFASMLLALTASVALAGGVNIAWGTLCYTENPVSSTTFACTVNTATGNRQMTVSFMLNSGLPDMVGAEWLIEGQSDLPALPDYWKLGIAPSTDCRAGRAQFINSFVNVESETCLDWTAGAGFPAPNFTWDTNKAHFTLGVAIDDGFPFSAQPDVEYYGGAVSLLNSKAVGAGSCGGCSAGMIFGLHTFTAAGKAGRRDDFTYPISGGNQCLVWNGSTQPCDTPVPARNTTWGQVKSLYR